MTDTQTKTHTEIVRAQMARIPPEKRSRMRWRTVWGGVIAVAGLSMGQGWIFPGLPMWVAFAVFGVGMLTASLQYLLHPLRLAISLLRDFVRAKRGEDGGPSPNDTLT